MKFFITDTEAIRLDAILGVDIEESEDEDDEHPCKVIMVNDEEWYLTREEGLELLRILKSEI